MFVTDACSVNFVDIPRAASLIRQTSREVIISMHLAKRFVCGSHGIGKAQRQSSQIVRAVCAADCTNTGIGDQDAWDLWYRGIEVEDVHAVSENL